MLIWMLIFWAITLGGVYVAYREMNRRGLIVSGPALGPITPRAILDRRLAAGDIGTEEYDALLRKIEEI